MTTQKPSLSSTDVQRLVKFAPLFDVEVVSSLDEDLLTLQIRNPHTGEVSQVVLPRDVAISRLLAEVCSRAVRWVYFHAGEPASRSFLRNTDARLNRIGELYSRWKEQGCPA